MNRQTGLRVGDIEDVLSSKQDVVEQPPTKRKGANLAQNIARSMGRRVVAAAQAEVMQEILAKLITTAYEETSEGKLWNIGFDGRIDGFNMPWSSAGYKEWGVKRTHARILQHTMVRNQTPFIFNEDDTRWYLDLDNYPSEASAFEWLKAFNLTGEMWLDLMDAWKNRDTQPDKKHT